MSEFRHKERKKVVAEITLSHVTEFAAEIGRELGQDEAMWLLNRGELAQEMWVHMMQAAEQYIKAALMKREFPRLCRGGSQTLRIPGVYLPLLPSFCRSPLPR